MICLTCSTTFEPRRHNQRFCSPECKWTHNNRNRVLKPNLHGTCKCCGNPFSRYVEPSKLASGLATGEFCSLQCKGKWMTGDRHPMWKGGRCIVNGYVWIYRPDHPHAKHQGYVLEHRLVMEQTLGRYLTAIEVVHHLDDNGLNNTSGNLELKASQSEHKKDCHEQSRQRNNLGQYLPVGS